MAIVPLGLLVASSCPSEKQEIQISHPIFFVYSIPADHLDVAHCLITECGLKLLRFHPANHQTCFNSNDSYTKSEKNIIQTGSEHWVLTPNFYGSVTEEKFPKTIQNGMKYRFINDDSDKDKGIPAVFLEEWLAIDPNAKQSILIISTGIEGKLGVSESLEKALKDKKEKGIIYDYTILRSKQAIEEHNKCVKEGKKVCAFIHTAG